jgi:hypothetical protein
MNKLIAAYLYKELLPNNIKGTNYDSCLNRDGLRVVIFSEINQQKSIQYIIFICLIL